jgi:hypothetical protein
MKGFRAGTIVAFLLALCAITGQASAQSSAWETIPNPVGTYQLQLSPAGQTAPALDSGGSTIVSGSSPAAPASIFQTQGSADQMATPFTVPSNWRTTYTYDCSAFADSQGGDFSIYIRMPDGSYSGANSPIHAHPYGDIGSGTQDYHTGGTFHFDVVSDCNWSITVPAP